eukprot:Awhi_evm1s12396
MKTGDCGSCYAFGAIGSLEGQWKKAKGQLINLSEQEVVDCSSKEGNLGCNGGEIDNVYEYVERRGLEAEKDYEYQGYKDHCRVRKAKKAVTLKSIVDIPSGSERALLEALVHVGPVAVGIDASNQSFQFYQSGVYSEPKCSKKYLDHVVLAVGYG